MTCEIQVTVLQYKNENLLSDLFPHTTMYLLYKYIYY